MFKVSQEICLSTNSEAKQSDEIVFGKYQKTPDMDIYPQNSNNVFIAPELTDVTRVQLLHFPNGAMRIGNEVCFIIKRNGVKGNFEVKVENPSGVLIPIPLRIVDPERLEVSFNLNQLGLYRVHISCNSVTLPRSPFMIVVISGEPEQQNKPEVPIFKSDASKVTYRGVNIGNIKVNQRNEFTIDGSEAGNNILFVGIFGPKGQCDEVVIKHMGRNVYRVIYQVQDPGEYILAAKWGDDHIQGSPFNLIAQ
ncbi:filamin-A [Episyrphus balteatus]|uniref:filamin-A n=1 Tax=Episyrphus balteatus TaxID=286459 RepID=UPI002485CC0A|nr:filamin-A [Episyrphus balteatus]